MILELNNITKGYPLPSDEGEGEMLILKSISLQVDKAESLAVIGPSGSGKSTLLNIIGALDKPNSGDVIFEGENLVKLDEKRLATIRNKKIGFVFQLHYLLPQCTVLENVLIPTLADKTNESKRSAAIRAEQLLKRVGLDNHLHHRPSQLSGGELQRTAVVRALINKPVLLLADEPTGSLDGSTANALTGLLGELNKEEQVALIVVTHSTKLAQHMQKVYSLKNGILESE